MIIVDVEQGTPDWKERRAGIPTASAYDRIITPATLKYSSGAAKYRNELVAEWLLGMPLDFGGSAFMDRGTMLEGEARAAYEFQTDANVQDVGFILREDGRTGGSPDGLVGDDGGLEIKCPAIQTHVGYMLDPAALTAEYRCQVQGYMYLTDRKWWDVMSYNPSLPSVIQRVYRDDAFMAALYTALARFLGELDDAKEELAAHRILAGV